MKQLIPLKKRSKREQKAYHAARRGSWHGLSPVTRVIPSGKAYNRNRTKRDTQASYATEYLKK